MAIPAAASSSSEAVTNDIRVQVEARYSREHSRSDRFQWFFLYTVTVSNEGNETVQLISRHWVITDATGRVQEVRGEGVVGEQPVLEPGDSFEYTSGCPLETPFGSMTGSYQMMSVSGGRFDAEIAEFLLCEPGAIH